MTSGNEQSDEKYDQQYFVTSKELLAVVVAPKTFHSYLFGQKVLLRIDNAAVTWMKNRKIPTVQTARWLQQIETHNLEVTHRPGKKHSNADDLSIRTCRSCERQEQMNSHGDSEDEFSWWPLPLCAISRSEKSKNLSLCLKVVLCLKVGKPILYVKASLKTKKSHRYLFQRNP